MSDMTAYVSGGDHNSVYEPITDNEFVRYVEKDQVFRVLLSGN